MLLKSCVPLLCSSVPQLKNAIQSTKADFLELYLDLVDHDFDGKLSEVKYIIQHASAKVIITLRRPKFASQRMSSDQRLKLIDQLSEQNVFFDFDINHEKEEIALLQTKNISVTKLIASFHDFNKTPTDIEILSIVSQLKIQNARIIKFSSNIQYEEDLDRMNALALSLSQSEEKSTWICSPMGEEFGKRGRIISGLLGSAWTYIQPPEELGLHGTAAGQVSFAEFESLKALCQI